VKAARGAPKLAAMIRHARTADHPAIREINETAFGKDDEARLIEALRANGDVMFELVAEAEGALVGHILFSRLWADRTGLIAALAPMAVWPGHQRRGLGGRLIETGIDTCRDFGAHAIVVLGHPDYYPRFGFSAEAARLISSPYSGSPAFMAMELERGALADPMSVAYPDPFSAAG
jgi:putative acetyltransferase